MADREKAIKGLEWILADDRFGFGINWETGEPRDDYEKAGKIISDTIALLKEQEPKQIVRKQGKRENSDGSIDYFGEWYCPHCGKLLNRGFDLPWIEHCYKCGGEVKWDE